MFLSSKKDSKNVLADFLADHEGPIKKFQIFIYMIVSGGWGL